MQKLCSWFFLNRNCSVFSTLKSSIQPNQLSAAPIPPNYLNFQQRSKTSFAKKRISYTQDEVDHLITKRASGRDPINFDNYASNTLPKTHFSSEQQPEFFTGTYKKRFAQNESLSQTLSRDLKIDELLQLFHKNYKNGIYSAVSFGSVISCLCRLGRIDEAIQYKQMMESNNMQPSGWVYIHIAKAFVVKKEYNNALFYILDLLQRSPVDIQEQSSDIFLVLIAIYVFQKWNLSKLMDILKKQLLFTLDELTANKLLVYFGDNDSSTLEEIEYFLNYLQSVNIPMNTLLCNSLLRCYTKFGAVEQAQELFEIMKYNTENLKNMHPIYKGTLSAYGYNIILHFYLKREDLTKVNEILDYLRFNSKKSINDNSALNLILKSIGDNYEEMKNLLLPVIEKYEPKDTTNVIMATASIVKVLSTAPMSNNEKVKVLSTWMPIFKKINATTMKCGLLVSFAFLIKEHLPKEIGLIHQVITPMMKQTTDVTVDDCSKILNMVRAQPNELFEPIKVDIFNILQQNNLKPNTRIFETLISRSVETKNKEEAQYYISSFFSSQLPLNLPLCKRVLEFEILLNKNVDNFITFLNKIWENKVFLGYERLLYSYILSNMDHIVKILAAHQSYPITQQQINSLLQFVNRNFSYPRTVIETLRVIEHLNK